ncbi:MAG: hypothetical protein Q7S90_04230, partial [Rubrivivax sp.]|nr:hypothetical protein [Rubrivivax sp.]
RRLPPDLRLDALEAAQINKRRRLHLGCTNVGHAPPGASGAEGIDGPALQAGVTAPRRRGVVDLVA